MIHTVSRRPRRNHNPEFNAKVALADIKGDKTFAQFLQWYNSEREHSSISKQTPGEAYNKIVKTFNLAT